MNFCQYVFSSTRILLKTIIKPSIFSRRKRVYHRPISFYPQLQTLKSYPMDEGILKSPNDKNLYRALKLENGLRVLLVASHVNQGEFEQDSDAEGATSEEETEVEESEPLPDISDGPDESVPSQKATKKSNMAAVSLCVNVGTFSDPPDLPGLAHFLEHMLTMGSAKYPEESAFEEFLSTSGGYSNAHTDLEHTNYHFEVTPKHLKGALDIFVSYFVSPLLKVDCMDRELEAVDGEFLSAVPNDSERLCVLLLSAAKQDNPMSKFSFGNIRSLKEEPAEKNIDVNAQLHAFYKRYYSAEHMTLVVQSPETLDTLESWVRELFPQIPNNGLPLDNFEVFKDPFQAELYNKMYKVVPVKNTHQLLISWVLSPASKFYRIKPLDYIEMCVAHEGKGSIMSTLRKRAWAIALVAGYVRYDYDMNSICSKFTIKVVLSDTGMDHIFEIVEFIFQYLKMMQTEKAKKYIFDEMQTIKAKSFEFMEQRNPTENVIALAGNMQFYPIEHYIVGEQLIFDYDAEVIEKCLSEFVLDRANIIVMSSNYSKDVECPQEEKWMQCKYGPYDVPQDVWNNWKDPQLNPEFHLPEPNKFIATNYELKHKDGSVTQYPVKLLEDNLCRVWFKGDTKFKVPKGYISLYIIDPTFKESSRNAAMTDLYVDIMNQMLTESLYGATVADLEYSIQSYLEGFIIRIGGFNHKLHLLLEAILDCIVDFPVEDDMFDSIKQYLLEVYQNSVLRPEKLNKDLSNSLLLNLYWTNLDKRAVLPSVTIGMLRDFARSCFKTCFVEGLFQGNFMEQEVMAMLSMAIEKLKVQPLPPEKYPDVRTVKIPVGNACCSVHTFNKEDGNSVIVNYYQIGEENLQLYCLLQLLTHYMWEPCFSILRTQEQLGYFVNCGIKSIKSVLGFNVKVVTPSSKFSCSHVNERIEEFLNNYLKKSSEIDEKLFATKLESFIQMMKTEDLSLQQEFYRFYYEMISLKYCFDRRERQLEFLEQLTIEQFRDFAKQFVDAKDRRKICIQVVGPSETSAEVENDQDKKRKAEDGDGEVVDSSEVCKYELRYASNEQGTNSFRITDIKKFKESLEIYKKKRID